ncbi:DUF397 domain-containing protein [Streptomyces sp. MST-110588]|uniref:DUF397 domain-containing protein n=1 Tax=Streptomyces sp. MST-110588 TaxID=2833628 RepID=UPI001F5C56AA|nr:DUF397 domain-containing protein [Streptomyces sp. MST-110588]UNO39425.1 DUF397 domain-containing protein [Streptomyces sp. MST-110588]
MVHSPAQDTQLRWFKSTYSGPDGGDCIEVAVDTTRVLVRDSKDAHGPRLRFSSASWTVFTSYAGQAEG